MYWPLSSTPCPLLWNKGLSESQPHSHDLWAVLARLLAEQVLDLVSKTESVEYLFLTFAILNYPTLIAYSYSKLHAENFANTLPYIHLLYKKNMKTLTTLSIFPSSYIVHVYLPSNRSQAAVSLNIISWHNKVASFPDLISVFLLFHCFQWTKAIYFQFYSMPHPTSDLGARKRNTKRNSSKSFTFQGGFKNRKLNFFILTKILCNNNILYK